MSNIFKSTILTAIVAMSAQFASAGILQLGPVKERVDNFDIVENVKAQGRHGSYTVLHQAKGEMQAQIFGAWRKIANAQVLLVQPSDIGGDVGKLAAAIKKTPALALRIKPSMNAPANYLATGLEKAKEKHPELTTPKGEIDKLIAAVKVLGSQNIKDMNFFVERRSATIYFEINDKLTEVESTEAFFNTLIDVWMNPNNGGSTGSIKIILR